MQYIKLASDRRCCTACLRKKTIQYGGLTITLPKTTSSQAQPYQDLIMEQDINAAMRKGFFQQVRVLAHLGCNVNAKDEHGRTPLMNCAMVDDQQWSVGLARTLLQHGAEPTATERTNGMSVMHLACILSQLELVRFLLKSAPDIDLRVADKRGNTPLHYAAAIGNHHIVAALLEACKHYQMKVTDITNKTGCTPLELAFTNEHVECCNLLRAAQMSLVPKIAGDVDRPGKAASVDQTTALSAATSRRVSEQTSADGELQQADSLGSSHNGSVHCDRPSNHKDVKNSHNHQADKHATQPLERADEVIESPPSESNKIDPTDMKATSSDVNDHLPVDTQQQFCTSSMTATSARQQRTESRQRRARRTVADMVDDQLKSTQSLRPNVAVRTSRHLLLDKTTAKIGSRPPSATQGSSNFPMNQSDVIPVEVLHARRLKTAASSDPRNKPFGNILPTSAEEFFAEPYHMRPITASVSKAHSTPNNGATWRSKISKLYHDYDYQFTTSYRCAAVPPPPQRRISGTDGAVTNDYEEDGLLRSQNGNGDIVWRSTIRTGSGRRSSMNRFNAAGNAVEIAAAANRKAISNASSLLSAMNSANATHRLKRGSAQATAPSLDSTDDAGAVPSLRPKSGRFAAAVAAVQKGRRGTETEDSIQQGIGQGGMRRPHMSIETRS